VPDQQGARGGDDPGRGGGVRLRAAGCLGHRSSGGRLADDSGIPT
jgi:hypothetical protein